MDCISLLLAVSLYLGVIIFWKTRKLCGVIVRGSGRGGRASVLEVCTHADACVASVSLV